MSSNFSVNPDWERLWARINQSAAILTKGDMSVRDNLISDARALITALETPSEFVMRAIWAEPARNTTLQLGIDLALFEQLQGANGEACTPKELASSKGADVEFVRRTMKHLAAMNIVKEAAVDSYKSTPLSNSLTVPKYRDGIPFGMGSAGTTFLKLPQYCAKLDYKNPVGHNPGPFQYFNHTERDFYEWGIHEKPEIGRAFHNYMMGYRDGAPKWTDVGFYPAEERFGRESTDEDILMIDIGGGKGHDLQAFHTNLPTLQGRLILQDKPAVLAQIPPHLLTPRIEKCPHDFFTPQPSGYHGARAYHLHSILHNWSDDDCIKILTHIAAAMAKGGRVRSRLLVFENVVPDEGASWKMTSLDWLMLANCGTVERTEADWRGLLARVGLRAEGIWTRDPTTESLIEAVLEA